MMSILSIQRSPSVTGGATKLDRLVTCSPKTSLGDEFK